MVRLSRLLFGRDEVGVGWGWVVSVDGWVGLLVRGGFYFG